MNNIKNIAIENTNYRVSVVRDGIKRTRRFGYAKFGGYGQAFRTAKDYVNYLKTCKFNQFVSAIRPVGRPLKSEFFGTNKLSLA